MKPDRPIRVRPARPDDATSVDSTVAEAYLPYLARMDQSPAPTLVDHGALIARGVVTVAADGPGRIHGVIVMWPHGDAMYVDNIAVAPNSQGSGVGRRLLAEAERQAISAGSQALTLYTNEAMVESLAFYIRHGFTETHRSTESGFHRIHLTRAVDPGHGLRDRRDTAATPPAGSGLP